MVRDNNKLSGMPYGICQVLLDFHKITQIYEIIKIFKQKNLNFSEGQQIFSHNQKSAKFFQSNQKRKIWPPIKVNSRRLAKF